MFWLTIKKNNFQLNTLILLLTIYFNLVKSTEMEFSSIPSYQQQLLSSADSLCKQFGPRSGKTEFMQAQKFTIFRR